MNKVIQLRQQPKSVFHPDVVVCIIRRGEIVPAKSENDIDCDLNPVGIKRARQLGDTFDAVGPRARFHYIVCSADAGSRQTAKEAFHQYGGTPWVEGSGRQLYASGSVADYAEMRKVHREVSSHLAIHSISSASYGAYKMLDTTRVLDRFKEETWEILLSFPGIKDARRIAIISHGVICNAIAEALFPQHKREIEEIELRPCDFIMVSAKECKYYPLMPQPD